MSDAKPSIGVLFVCHANVCRSPLAEGLMRELARRRGGDLLDRLVVASAGTHAIDGASPHPLSCAIAEQHGFQLAGEARQLVRDDLSRFDHVVVMDRRNLETLQRLSPVPGSLAGYRADIRLLRAIAKPKARGRDLDVPDPIGHGERRYAEVYAMLEDGINALLDELAR